jgi:hypothetical protein
VASHRSANSNLPPISDADPYRASSVTDDWLDLLKALHESGARFLVVGAHAMAVHGVPRGTQDLDIWIDRAHDNADRVWHALVAFGAPLSDLDIARSDLERPAQVIQLGLPPNRVDLLTTVSGVESFDHAWADRVAHDVQGVSVPFIGRDALVANKQSSGRRKDLADLEALGELPPS